MHTYIDYSLTGKAIGLQPMYSRFNPLIVCHDRIKTNWLAVVKQYNLYV